MSEAGKLILLYAYAYLVGSIPTANIIARLVKGIDLREYGSGNVGGSNLAQHVGVWWILPMGLVDVFVKGASAVWIGHYVPFFGWDLYSAEMVGAGLVAISGHNWSLYLKFKGGRGIAVAVGVMYAIAPWELSLFAATGLLLWAMSRSAAVSVYVALLLLPFWTLVPWASVHRFLPWAPVEQSLTITWFMVGMLALVTAKRLLSNWTPFPKGHPWMEVLYNRLFHDRDIKQREPWVRRTPDEVKGKE
jgi:glycerol-3-phosphate acyltransferase PlsY